MLRTSARLLRTASPLSTMSTTSSTLRVLNAQLPPSRFKRDLFSILRESGAVIVTGLSDDFTLGTSRLLSAYDQFLGLPNEAKKPYQLDPSLGVGGFRPYPNLNGGALTANRFLIMTDANGVKPQLPPPQAYQPCMYCSMRLRERGIASFTGDLAEALDEGFNLPHKPFDALLRSSVTTTVLDSYVPVTRETLLDLMRNRRLQKTEDGRFIIFNPHSDTSLISLLTFRNNHCGGLELNTSKDPAAKKFEPVVLPQDGLSALIILGSLMEYITNGEFKAPEHRVIAKPLARGQVFSRTGANTFFYTRRNLTPVLSVFTSQINEDEHVAMLGAQYDSAAERNSLRSIGTCELNEFPRGHEVDEISPGTYMRR